MTTSSHRGFTLIETLVAVSILALAAAGPLFTASRAIIAAQTARDQLIASYLAQEGAEYVRLMRDSGYLALYREGGSAISTAAWDDFLNGSSATSITGCRTSACTVDPGRTMGTGSNLSLTACEAGSCGPLYKNGNLYTQTASGTATPFTRTVQAITLSATEIRVVSTVSWDFHGIPYSIVVRDHLTPWP